jgi:hypothetical protein
VTTAVSLRALNRTLLRRQHLDVPWAGSVEDLVGHLVAVQAQEPNWAIVGLWTRLADLDRDAVGTLTAERALVRSPLLRGTQHLSAAADFAWLRPTLQPTLDRLVRSRYYTDQTTGIDPAELVAAAREVLGDRTVSRRQLAAALAGRYPGRRGAVLVAAVEALLPVAHDPATSAWGSWWSRRSIGVTDAREWLGRPVAVPDVERLVRRYLAAFGPAGVMDVQAWSGLTRLREVVDGMRAELRALHGPDGTELLDLPGAEVAADDAPVPVRLVAAFDDVLLGHRDRTRVLPEEHRPAVMPGWSMVHATVLVDGFVAATWELEDDGVVVHPLRPLTSGEADDVAAEATRALRFMGRPDARVRFDGR